MITYDKETPVLLITSGSIETIRQIYNMLQRIEPLRQFLAELSSLYGVTIHY